MDEVMQELFYHILENTLERYYPCTAYEQWRGKRDAAGRTLWEQLPPGPEAPAGGAPALLRPHGEL